jgi:hypothetical protein
MPSDKTLNTSIRSSNGESNDNKKVGKRMVESVSTPVLNERKSKSKHLKYSSSDDIIPNNTTEEIDLSQYPFLYNLNMSSQQLSDLSRIPKIFYYLRPRTQSENNLNLKVTKHANTNKQTVSSSQVKLKPILKSTLSCVKCSDSIYDLEVAEFSQVDKNYYFTLSLQGVTLFSDKESYFTPLAQWNRESDIYRRITDITFFKLYRRWKVNYYLS